MPKDMLGRSPKLGAFMLVAITLFSSAIACGSTTPEPIEVMTVAVATEAVTVEAIVTASPLPPTPTPTAIPDPISQALLPTAGELCESTHTIQPEHEWALSPELGAAALINIEYEDQGWQLSELFTPPESAEDIHTVACIQQTRINKGTYIGTVGGTAYQPQWDIWLISWPEGELLGGKTFLGGSPPSTITSSGAHYGALPEEEAATWLDHVLSEPLFAAQVSAAGVQVSDDAETLLVDLWQEVAVVDIESGEETHRVEFTGEYAIRIAFSPDAAWLAARVCTQLGDGTCTDWEIQVRDSTSGELEHTFTGLTGYVPPPAFSPDNRLLAIASSESVERTTRAEVILWDLSTGQSRTIISGEVGHVYGMLFTPDGTRLITDINESVGVWDIQSGEKVASVPVSDGDWLTLVISPDGRTLAVSMCIDHAERCYDSQVLLWDLEEEREIAVLQVHNFFETSFEISTLTFSPDSSKLAVASCAELWFAFRQDDSPTEYCVASRITLWDSATAEMIGVTGNHLRGIAGLDFTPDGTHLVSVGYDGVVRFWPIE